MAYGFVKASSQYLSINDTAALDITGAITVACWAKRSSDLTTEQQLVAKYESSAGKLNQRSYLLSVTTSGNLVFITTQDGTGSTVSRRDSTSITTGAIYQHLCGTWSPLNYPNVYIAGSLSNGAAQGGGTNTSIHSGTANLTLGAGSTGTGAFFTGDMAEIGIWNAALTAAEIASLAKGMTPDKIRPQSLVFYSPLVRDLIDQKGGLTITNNNGATVANHPRVYA
jgi:hypothetical protein